MVLKTCIASGLAAVVLSAGFTAAAETPEDAVARCALNADLNDRITCLEGALLGTSEALPESAKVSPEVSVTAGAPEPLAAEDTSLGAEQVAQRAPRKDRASADNERSTFNVASTRTVPYKKLEVTLENGQVWIQSNGDSRDIYVPKRFRDSLTVEIWPASLGGYRMHLKEIKKTIRVRRLK